MAAQRCARSDRKGETERERERKREREKERGGSEEGGFVGVPGVSVQV